MANSGPNTNGSQFFLVYQNTTLSPAYTPFGTIVSGLNIIQQVAKAGTTNSNGPGDGAPKEKVQIESVTIKKT
jgi:peptidyl-prolyl cis-trans isomerase B (cyclophilin B)